MHVLQSFDSYQITITEGPELHIAVGGQPVGGINLGPAKALALINGLTKAIEPWLKVQEADGAPVEIDCDEDCVVILRMPARTIKVQSTPEDLRRMAMKMQAAADHADFMAQANKAGLN